MFVNVGRDDGVKTSEFREALDAGGLGEADTAYIRIRQRHTFVGVKQGLMEQAVKALTGRKLADREALAEPARPRLARRPN